MLRSRLESEAPLRSALEEELRALRAKVTASTEPRRRAGEDSAAGADGSDSPSDGRDFARDSRVESVQMNDVTVAAVGSAAAAEIASAADGAKVRRLEQEVSMLRSRLEMEAANGVQL